MCHRHPKSRKVNTCCRTSFRLRDIARSILRPAQALDAITHRRIRRNPLSARLRGRVSFGPRRLFIAQPVEGNHLSADDGWFRKSVPDANPGQEIQTRTDSRPCDHLGSSRLLKFIDGMGGVLALFFAAPLEEPSHAGPSGRSVASSVRRMPANTRSRRSRAYHANTIGRAEATAMPVAISTRWVKTPESDFPNGSGVRLTGQLPDLPAHHQIPQTPTALVSIPSFSDPLCHSSRPWANAGGDVASTAVKVSRIR